LLAVAIFQKRTKDNVVLEDHLQEGFMGGFFSC
jgi:hypothetical protein